MAHAGPLARAEPFFKAPGSLSPFDYGPDLYATEKEVKNAGTHRFCN